jgi:hypothetical protein
MKTQIPLALLVASASGLVVGLSIECAYTYGMKVLGQGVVYAGAFLFLTAALCAWFWREP